MKRSRLILLTAASTLAMALVATPASVDWSRLKLAANLAHATDANAGPASADAGGAANAASGAGGTADASNTAHTDASSSNGTHGTGKGDGSGGVMFDSGGRTNALGKHVPGTLDVIVSATSTATSNATVGNSGTAAADANSTTDATAEVGDDGAPIVKAVNSNAVKATATGAESSASGKGSGLGQAAVDSDGGFASTSAGGSAEAAAAGAATDNTGSGTPTATATATATARVSATVSVPDRQFGAFVVGHKETFSAIAADTATAKATGPGAKASATAEAVATVDVHVDQPAVSDRQGGGGTSANQGGHNGDGGEEIFVPAAGEGVAAEGTETNSEATTASLW